MSLETYPVPTFKQTLATIISVTKFALLYFIISQNNPLITFGLAAEGSPTPPWLASMQENKVYTCLMIFFLSNAMESTLTSTGAFEVYANNERLYSKIETGQVPQPQFILGRLDEMLGKPPGSDNFSPNF